MRRFVLHRLHRRAAVASALASAAACSGGPSAAPPAAEFLVAAADSTDWVTAGPRGVHLRGAPLTLASAAGRFYELFVTDDDRSFYDAVLVGQRLYRRDLLTGDSAIVFADSVVPVLARGYAAAHPADYPLEVDEEPSDDPVLVANAEVELLAVHGPYATYEYHTDVERTGSEARYAVRRGVVDWRTGRTASLAALFDSAAAHQLAARGRRQFAAALDSVRRSADPRAADARAALAGFRFDERSFSLTAVDGRPAVSFVALGAGSDAGGMTLELPPLAAPTTPAWWPEASAALALASNDPVSDRWNGAGYAVRARYTSDTAAALALVDRREREWPVGRVQASVSRVLWLDRPALDAATRRALQRAFDESALYDEEARLTTRVRHHPPRRALTRLAAALRRTRR